MPPIKYLEAVAEYILYLAGLTFYNSEKKNKDA